MTKVLIKTFLISTILLSSSSFASDKLTINFTKETSGEIRKLKVYKYPAWVSKINFSNKKEAFFSSPKSMFEFYFNKNKWQKFDVKTVDDLEDLLVTDFKTHDIIDAKKAYFIYGSNKISPAGDDLVAFKTQADAKNFKLSNRGQRIFRFSEVSNGLIRLLNGRI
jgi:nitrous oxide reductase accessory protein NosL